MHLTRYSIAYVTTIYLIGIFALSIIISLVCLLTRFEELNVLSCVISGVISTIVGMLLANKTLSRIKNTNLISLGLTGLFLITLILIKPLIFRLIQESNLLFQTYYQVSEKLIVLSHYIYTLIFIILSVILSKNKSITSS